MEGAAVAEPDQEQQQTARTTSFEALSASNEPKAPPRKAPNPLRSASPERLQAAREEVKQIITARRNGLSTS